MEKESLRFLENLFLDVLQIGEIPSAFLREEKISFSLKQQAIRAS